MAHCLSDVEFLAKLHGVRLAFEVHIRASYFSLTHATTYYLSVCPPISFKKGVGVGGGD